MGGGGGAPLGSLHLHEANVHCKEALWGGAAHGPSRGVLDTGNISRMTGSGEPAAWLGLIHGATKGAVASMPTHANLRSRQRPGVAAGAKDTHWEVPQACELRRGATSRAVGGVWGPR